MATLPPSSSSALINFIGGLSFLAVIFYLKDDPGIPVLLLTLYGLLTATTVIIMGEVLFLNVHKRPSAGLRHDPAPWCYPRIATKLAGFYATLLLFIGVYIFLPEYHKGMYAAFQALFFFALPLVVVFGSAYIATVDRYLLDPCDSLLEFGKMVLGRWRQADLRKAKDYILSVALRGFFIPLMGTLMLVYVSAITAGPEKLLQLQDDVPTHIEILKIFLYIYLFFMAFDMVFGVVGYLAVFRPLDAHIRSTMRSGLGWFVCLACYHPIFDLSIIMYVLSPLFENPKWYVWLEDYPVAIIIWGSLTVLAMCLESFGAMSFGIRFSNLTYRGITTSGLFRYTKHPQYISKIFNRFFVYMPFLSLTGIGGVVLGMLAFCVLTLLYYLRARTEENDLVRYPDYVEYANYINQHGCFRFMGRIFPFLRFSEESARQGKLF